MNVKGLIGYNAFQTAENVCGAIRLYNLGMRELKDIIEGIHTMHFLDIDDVPFAQTLFQYLTNWQEPQEGLLEMFFKNFTEGMSPMQALSTAVNLIHIGEAE